MEIDWLFEHSYNWEIYTSASFSVSFVKDYFRKAKKSPYLCLWDHYNEECIRCYGQNGWFILEGDLWDNPGHFVLAGSQVFDSQGLSRAR